MNILLIDFDAAMVDFSMRCRDADGHEVRHWMPEATKLGPVTTGNGLVRKVKDWRMHTRWADLIVLGTNNGKWMATFDRLRKQGYPIFGPTAESAEWENSRQRGQEVLQSAGVPIADSIPFTSFKQAAAFVAKGKTRYVCKPDGDVDKALSYVAKGTEDLRFMLEYWQKHHKGSPSFVLQEFIPGIEFAVGGFFGPGGWCGPWLENFEHKKLMAGDVGPNTGEMGTVLKYVGDSLLADKVLRPLEGELYRQGYSGYIDVSVIVDERGRPWPLEFTTRFGHPLWMIQQALHPDYAGWMKDLVDGKDSFKPVYDVAVGIVVGMRDFPYSIRPKEEASGFPIFGYDKPGMRRYLHPDDMMLGEALGKPAWVSSGPQPLTVSGTEGTVTGAVDDAYNNLSKLVIPNSPLYRVDIGKKVGDKIRTLKQHGFATEWRV